MVLLQWEAVMHESVPLLENYKTCKQVSAQSKHPGTILTRCLINPIGNYS